MRVCVFACLFARVPVCMHMYCMPVCDMTSPHPMVVGLRWNTPGTSHKLVLALLFLPLFSHVVNRET